MEQAMKELFLRRMQEQAARENNGGAKITEVNDSDSDTEESKKKSSTKPPPGISYFPVDVLSKTVKFVSQPVRRGPAPTIFFGLMTEKYPQESWEIDSAELGRLFNFDHNDSSICKHLQFVPEVGNNQRLDIQLAVKKIHSILEGSAPFDKTGMSFIRFVRMGNAGHSFLYDAVKYILKKLGSPTMTIQFVTLGDSSDNDWLVFCKNLCGTDMVAELEFFNPMDYNPFGYYREKKD